MGRAGKGGLTAAEEVRCLNVIGDYVARRDVPALTRAALAEAGVSGGVADVAVLFGGSIVAGGDTFAEAMRAGVARTYVIVGGAGHTTATLRERMRELCPGARFADDAPRRTSSRPIFSSGTAFRRTFSSGTRRTPATT